MTKPRYKTNVVLYLVGSLRNPAVPLLAKTLREQDRGFTVEIFDDWFAASKIADDSWRDYETARGHSYQEALNNHAAKHIFAFDRFHLNRAHGGILLLPTGRSGHLEAGFLAGSGKPVFMLLADGTAPARLDVMTQFLDSVHYSSTSLEQRLATYPWPKFPPIPHLTVEDCLWLAGLLEGEGSFCVTSDGDRNVVPRLVLQMTDRDVVARAARIFNRKLLGPYLKPTPYKAVWACTVAGVVAIEWMRILRPYLGQRRQEQILNTVKRWLETRQYRQQDTSFWRSLFSLTDKPTRAA